MKKLLASLLLVLMVMVLAACTTGSDAGQEEPADDNEAEATENGSNESDGTEEASGENVLYLNNGEEPTSFNPPIGFDEVSWLPLNQLMEGLTRLGEDHTPQPAMAEEWEVSDDGTVYTFHLREDANWSNGDPVTAQDFVFAWEQLLNPETGSPAAFLGYFIKGGEAYNSGEGSAEDLGLTAVDEKTFEVELESPTGFFLHVVTNPAFFPINHQVAEENPEWHAEAESFVANGPFLLESWAHDSEMVFAKNPEYWDADAVSLDKIHWAMVNDTNTQYQMFETGELDIGAIPPELSDQLIDGENVTIDPLGGLEFYRFNVTEEPFQNKKIRQAFALAINQGDIAEYVVKNGVEPAYGFVSPGFISPSGEDFREVNGDLVGFDAEQAQQLLQEGMEEEGYDELPPITLSYNTADLNKSIAETMQSMLSENLGVEVTLENTEWNVFLEDQKNLQHQFSRSSFLFDYADPVNFLESFTTESSMNRTGWSNEEYDQLIADIKAETNEEARWELMYEAEKLLAEEMPILPLRYYNQVFIQQEGVSGVLRHPVGYADFKHAEKQ
ncbi:peptide ABC transporter substrate-binding protein [Lentibacillus sediminis]|uniref:peptide ABC transporter substrate-binding protein n=1 Tax=Lentibacillus sediminis TaxID=1940529 RepID=UPI000C1C2190|nr:peptide ABC transporter substrate-binding protein [Lentibacillus sediminis]